MIASPRTAGCSNNAGPRTSWSGECRRAGTWRPRRCFARDEGLPLPAGLVLLTPELDLTESGDSFETNRYADVVLVGSLAPTIAMYAGGADLSNPYLSPLFGDLTKGFPRTYLQAGTRDLFLSNTVRMHRYLRRAGVPVELHIVEGAPHGGMLGNLRTPEDAEMDAEMKRFATECWTLA